MLACRSATDCAYGDLSCVWSLCVAPASSSNPCFLSWLRPITDCARELMYRRDYRLLDLKWQDMTQLFTRGDGQWLTMGLIFGNLIVASVLGFGAVIIANIIQQPLLISILLSCLILMVLGLAQLWIQNLLEKLREALTKRDHYSEKQSSGAVLCYNLGMMKRQFEDVTRIVIKIGTSSLVLPTGKINLEKSTNWLL